MEKITSKHFIFFIIATLSTTLFNYPSLFIRLGGRNTWVFSIIASVIFFFFVILILSIVRKNNAYKFDEVCYTALGKPLGTLFLVIFSIGLVLICIESASVSSSAIHTNIFIATPIWYSLVFFIGTTLFISKNGFKSVLITAVVSVSIASALAVLIGILSIKYTDLRRLLPILKNTNVTMWTSSILSQVGALSSFFVLLPFLKRVDDKNNLRKVSLITIPLVLFCLIFFIVNLISSIGAERSGNIFYPEFIQAQLIYFGGFIENGDIITMTVSLLLWTMKYVISIFSLYSIWEDKFKNKLIFLSIVSIVVYISSLYLAKNVYTLFNILPYYQYISLVIFFILPIIIYGIYPLRKKAKVHK
ncbi:MAG: GerAB/ArcD/ProY family transporter [Clostridium perfringens]|nr:GerAB/ArcD/ProY family transporter [Clostridium perfringens]